MVRLSRHLLRVGPEALIITAFFVAGALLARSVLLVPLPTRGIFFYQTYFGAAVLDACGMGFREFRESDAPAPFTEFMESKRLSLSCNELPRNLPLEPPNWLVQRHRYMAAAITALWRIRGVSWGVLGPLFEIGSGLVAALAYALGRLALNRFWASTIAIGMAFSGLNLGFVPWLRDYWKAPFVLASLLLCAILATRGTSWRRVVWLSIAQGVLMGIAFGFRTDILLAIPLFVLSVLFFLPAPLKSDWKVRPVALGAFLMAFVLTGWPVLRSYSQGSNGPHLMLLGLAQPFDVALGVAPADHVVSPSYWDLQTEMRVRAYAHATGGDDWATVTTQSYDRAAWRYLSGLVALVPADVLLRMYAAVLTTFRLPSSPESTLICSFLTATLSGRACTVHDRILPRLQPLVLPSAILAVLLLAAISPRLASFVCAAVVVLAGGTMVQFDPRHVFHLEVLPLMALACAGQVTVTTALGFWHRRGLRPVWTDSSRRRQVIRSVAAGVVFLVVPAGALWVARGWQQRSFEKVIERYIAADTLPLPLTWVGATSGVARITTDSFLPPIDRTTWRQVSQRAEVIRMELGGSSCAGREVVITRLYKTMFGPTVVSVPAVFRWKTPADGAATIVFFPIYRALVGQPEDTAPQGTFEAPGIDLEAADVPCVRSFARVREPDAFALQLAVAVPPDWRGRPHYQMLAQLGGPLSTP